MSISQEQGQKAHKYRLVSKHRKGLNIMRSYLEKVVTDKNGNPIKFERYGIIYSVSGACNFCGKCCQFYTTHGYKCNFFKDNKCEIQDTKPEWCRKYPGNESFELMPKDCSYIVTKEDTKEIMKFSLEDTMAKQNEYPYKTGKVRT